MLRPRKVRCRRCQEVWLATPEAEDEIFDPGPPIAEPQPLAQTPVPAFFANRAREVSLPAAISPAPSLPAARPATENSRANGWPR
jgi:hypothetical protein